jgi:hypothetical protein
MTQPGDEVDVALPPLASPKVGTQGGYAHPATPNGCWGCPADWLRGVGGGAPGDMLGGDRGQLDRLGMQASGRSTDTAPKRRVTRFADQPAHHPPPGLTQGTTPEA